MIIKATKAAAAAAMNMKLKTIWIIMWVVIIARISIAMNGKIMAKK